MTFKHKDLENDNEANLGRTYRQCSMSVIDTIANPNVTFDKDGVCSYYKEYKQAESNFVLRGQEGRNKLEQEFDKIKKEKGKKKYDSILGLSGGVDSTYLCLLAKEHGLNPLIVHFDNGWNSELAQHNIEQTVKICDFDLYTYVINWNEFRSMQLAYLKASVVDIEVLTDHAFMTVLLKQAKKWKLKYVLAGMNIVTENVMPTHWVYDKNDTENIKDIVNRYGDIKVKDLKTFPFMSYLKKMYLRKKLGLTVITPLNWIAYNYDDVKKQIKEKLNWRDYGGKHYESIWTRFYQGYVLPKKFHIDKRKAHLSNLIFSGQLTKHEALEILKNPILPSKLEKEDTAYVLKKFGLSEDEFQEIMTSERQEHKNFKTDKAKIDRALFFWKILKGKK